VKAEAVTGYDESTTQNSATPTFHDITPTNHNDPTIINSASKCVYAPTPSLSWLRPRPTCPRHAGRFRSRQGSSTSQLRQNCIVRHEHRIPTSTVAGSEARGYIMFSRCHHVAGIESSVARLVYFRLCAGPNAHACVVHGICARTRLGIRSDDARRVAEVTCACGSRNRLEESDGTKLK
jgi:hypothetical protein